MKTKNKKSLPTLILESLINLAESYTKPLSYYEEERLYQFLLGAAYPVLKRYRYRQALNRLTKRGLITIHKGPKIKITLTAKGHKQINKKEIVIPKLKKWDGKWRLVIFDIPEKQKRDREKFRYYLKFLGLTQVQESVWAHPFPCREAIAEVCRMYNVSDFVSVFEGNHLGDDENLRKIFKV